MNSYQHSGSDKQFFFQSSNVNRDTPLVAILHSSVYQIFSFEL